MSFVRRWLIIIVVMTAYCAYWSSYSINPYATDVALTTVAFAGAISVARMWLKPLSGFVAGFVADRFGVAISTTVLFAMLVVSFLGLAALSGNLPGFYVMLGFMAVAAIAIFAQRDAYPGADGYRYLFLITARMCTAGLIASLTIYFKYVRSKAEVPA